MIDFMMVSTRSTKNGVVEIYPTFRLVNPSEDLMIRGGDFYAIWVEERGLWSVSEQDVIEIVDRELDRYAKANANRFENGYRVLHMWNSESGSIDRWHKYCQKQMRDSFHMLDEKLIFSNTTTNRKDYASKKLPYPLETGEPTAWNKILSVLYSPEERHKIEWAIGSIVSGDSRKLQKFLVFYGETGTGKSTVINVIEKLFEGYTGVFDAKALGSSSNSFALEAFRDNPLVAIQHDGDLSRIEDNTRLNSLVSHEKMTVNEKFRKAYANKFKCFLFMGTNKPVQITDAKSGLIRRLIDVSPSGEKIPLKEYNQLVKQIDFELGAIANHCQGVYLENPEAYNNYIPVKMLGASNDFYNFVMDSWVVFKKEDETTLKAAWEMYKTYCEDTKVPYPYPQRKVKEELKNYFRVYEEREMLDDGTRVRNYYKGFRYEKFEESEDKREDSAPPIIEFKKQKSLLDEVLKDCPAQYATEDGTPMYKWENVSTSLSKLDTSKVHYVRVPYNHIVIDFDMIGTDGKKDFQKNLDEAGKWPPTYAEVSKSGEGIHLHYIYAGDPSQLSCVYDNRIEVKVFTGNASLRRKLTLCNNLPIATLSHGLPLKEAKKTVNFDCVQSEKGLRNLIERNLRKEIHPGTKPSIDFIHKILEDAYASDLSYDVSDMRNAVIAFAAGSSHQADYCLKLTCKMRFQSKEDAVDAKSGRDEDPMVFYDVEVFPNLFLVNYKFAGEGKSVIRMINPKPAEIEQLMKFKLVGFNCRRYDNHILYARLIGYSNKQLYDLSQRIIVSGKRSDCFFGEAYNVSYTDVYDFASANNKQSLKKFEIKLGIHHQELGLPWDKPVAEELWNTVAEYCDNDVLATEAVFNHLSADWTARRILADIAGMTVNDTTNSLTTRIIFDRVRNPQSEFNYRNLAEPVRELKKEVMDFLLNATPEMMEVTHGDDESLLPYFPGYTYDKGVSLYRNEEVGEGGFVYAEKGIYGNVALLDIASMHPSSVIAECLFGPRFTKKFKEIVDGRVSIKHKAWNEVDEMLGGKLTPYVKKVQNGEMTAKELANALKTAINSVYGLTSAAFENAFRDPRNKDNIVAKRGALFMIDLKNEVQKLGYTVAHIKTDSIKIPDSDPKIIKFVMDYGKRFGYTFEHEATYDKMCLVNESVYIAKYDTVSACAAKYGYVPGDIKDHAGQWTATGKQFAVPYVFKTLFSKEPITFEDMCETFSVSGALYLDMNEKLPNVEALEKTLAKKLKEYNLSQEDVLDFKETGILPEECDTANVAIELRSLMDSIAEGHYYRFIGRVGQFCPMEKGCGGGLLMRESGGKYSCATGSKDYRWMESEMVKTLGKEAQIDQSFYRKLVDDARDAISKYGDFEWFASEDKYDVPPEGRESA